MNNVSEEYQRKYTTRENLRYLLRGFWQLDKKQMLLSLTQLFPRILLPLFSLLLSRLFIDCIVNHRSARELIVATLLFILVFGVLRILEKHLEVSTTLLGVKRRHQYYIDRFDKLVTIRYDVLESPNGRKLTKNSEQFIRSENGGARAFWDHFRVLLLDLLGIAGYSAIIGAVQPWLIVVVLAITILIFWLGQLDNKQQVNKYRQISTNYLKHIYLQRTLRELTAGKDVRLFGMRPWFTAKRHDVSEERFAIDRQYGRKFTVYGTLTAVLVAVRDLTAYLVFIAQVLQGRMSPADFVFCIGLVMGFSNWTLNIQEKMRFLDHDLRECDEFRQFLDLPDTQLCDAMPPDQPLAPCRVSFDHVHFSYPDAKVPVLKDVTFTVEPGEHIALVGVNGAGKTTCMKLLCGLYLPDQGEVRIDGKKTSDYRPEELLQRFSALFQEYVSLPVSVAQNVSMLPEAETDQARVRFCLQQAGLLEKIEQLPDGLETLLDKTLSENAIDLSGGERQRLLLARALYKSAPIILLDEPTAALDPLAEQEMYLRYHEMTHNRTAFYISHRLASTRFCDRILLLEHGRIAECGTHQQLIDAHGSYAKMFEVQSRYYREQEEA